MTEKPQTLIAPYIDADVSLSFLKALRLQGPWVLTAIVPDGATTTCSFTHEADVRKFIEKYNCEQNIYFTGNLCGRPSKKPTKADMTGAIFLHTDDDPRDGETPEAAKARILATYAAHDLPPSIIIDSGNGLQGLWLLDTDYAFKDAAGIAEIEERNRALATALGTTRGTHNVDRLLRLPGTINYPNRKKREKGRVACRANIVQVTDARYSLDQFAKSEKTKSENFDRHPKPPISNGASLDFNDDAEPSGFSSDFNDAGVQRDGDYYQDIIINGAPEGERSEKFQEAVWHLAANGLSIEEIVDELAKYPYGIAQKYAGRLLKEVERSFDKWRSTRRAEAVGTSVVTSTVNRSNGSSTSGPSTSAGSFNAGTAPPGTAFTGSSWIQIRVVPSQLPRVIREAEDALLKLDDEIYQRGSAVVRPVLDQSLKMSVGREEDRWQLVEVTRPYLVEVLCRAAEFQRYDKRAKKFVAIDAPDKVAEAYLNQRGRWRLPILIGIVNTPFLRADGSICETVGYDAESRVLFKASEAFPPVPKFPDKRAAMAALGKLRKLIETFPFVTDADRSVSLAGMLTALDRKAMRTAPLIGFTAPAPRTGKSLLVDVINMLAAGRSMPVMSQGKTTEEFEKRLHAALLAGDACISIDNCEQTITGDALCQALTQDEMSIRILGLSRNVRTATGATIFATGNNLIIGGDLTDRCLLASLDANVERPGLRRFTVNVLEEAHSRRAELVVAALTVLRAWHVARGQGERVDVNPFGGFEDWSWRVRETLIWLGEADPYDTVEKVQEKDPELDLRTAVMTQWQENIGVGSRSSIHDILACAILVPSFYEALLRVAERGSSGTVSHERLGRWLHQVQGKILNEFKIIKVGIEHGYSLWSLVR